MSSFLHHQDLALLILPTYSKATVPDFYVRNFQNSKRFVVKILSGLLLTMLVQQGMFLLKSLEDILQNLKVSSINLALALIRTPVSGVGIPARFFNYFYFSRVAFSLSAVIGAKLGLSIPNSKMIKIPTKVLIMNGLFASIH